MTPPRDRLLDLCAFCPDLCLDVCPVGRATGNTAFSPWHKMSLLRALEKGLVPADDAVVGALHECVGCLACSELCEHSQPVAETLFEARRRYPWPADFAPAPAAPDLAAIAARVVPPHVREDDALAMLLPGSEVLLSRPGAVADAFRVLSALGADGVAFTTASLLDDGSAARAAGDVSGGLRAAVTLAQNASRYKRVIVLGAHALHTLTAWLPTQGRGATTAVVSLADEVAMRLERWPSALAPDTRRVAVHDACLLARTSRGSGEALRRVVAHVAGRPPLELAHTGRNTWCCGRGAIYHAVRPTHAEAIARLAVDEARAAGAELLVCGCPASATAFEQAGFPAVDLAGYLASRLPPA
jgi:Fe-S oxidoreductase